MSKKKIFEKDSNLANEDSGFAANEYEREPVPEHKAKGLKSFLGLFATMRNLGRNMAWLLKKISG